MVVVGLLWPLQNSVYIYLWCGRITESIRGLYAIGSRTCVTNRDHSVFLLAFRFLAQKMDRKSVFRTLLLSLSLSVVHFFLSFSLTRSLFPRCISLIPLSVYLYRLLPPSHFPISFAHFSLCLFFISPFNPSLALLIFALVSTHSSSISISISSRALRYYSRFRFSLQTSVLFPFLSRFDSFSLQRNPMLSKGIIGKCWFYLKIRDFDWSMLKIDNSLIHMPLIYFSMPGFRPFSEPIIHIPFPVKFNEFYCILPSFTP